MVHFLLMWFSLPTLGIALHSKTITLLTLVVSSMCTYDLVVVKFVDGF